KDMKLTEIKLDGRKITFKLPDAPGNAMFVGEFNAEGEEITGTLKQNGGEFPFLLVRQEGAELADENARLEQALKDYKAMVDSLIVKRHVPGVGICMVHKGEILMSEGFGFANLEEGKKVDANTMFAIGSSSKAFTTAILGMLVEDGKMDWETPVREYMPDFRMYDPFATEHMTALDLVTHRSGLPRHDIAWYGTPATREELYQRLRYFEPTESFRAKWQYQNLMYMTAGWLAEKVTGKTWEELVDERIFTPLGMKRSNTSVKVMYEDGNNAAGYRYDGEEDRFVSLPYRDLSTIGPAGSINSSVTEMAEWLKLHLNKGKVGEEALLSPQSIMKMHAPQMVMGAPAGGAEFSERNYGLGWMIYEYKGHKVVEHGGNIDGFSASVFLMPKDNFGMVVLTNANATQLPTVLTHSAVDRVLNLEETDWDMRLYFSSLPDEKGEEDTKDESPVPNTKPSHDLKAYAGDYDHPGYGTLEVRHEDGRLYARLNGLKAKLSHWHYDVFNGAIEDLGQDMRFTFSTNALGDIDKVSAPFEPTLDDIIFEKIPPKYLSDPAWQAKVLGRYDLEIYKLKIVQTGGNRLQAVMPSGQAIDLEPARENEFNAEGLNGFSIVFQFDKKGNCTGLVAKQPGAITEAKKLEE
ncbi:MAG: serine hydrolase, partial [Bacteroidota bacterium]